MECFRQVESSFVETFHFAVVSSGPFGEDGYGVPFSDFFTHPFHTKFIPFVHMEKTGVPDDFSEYRRTPYPMIGNHNNLWRERQQFQNIDERLVIGYYDGRFPERLTGGVDMFFAYECRYCQYSLASDVDNPANELLLTGAAYGDDI